MGKAPAVRDLGALQISLGLVLIIIALDWLTPPGIIVGMLLAVPLLIVASLSQRTRDVWIVLAVAMVGFLVAKIFDRPSSLPAEVWLPNRLITLLAIPAAGILGAYMQQRRLEAEQARDAALAADGTNRLLFSLLAHDLRSPLVLSRQMLDYVQQCIDEGSAPEASLLSDVRLRLDRNLRVIDGVLASARAELDEGEMSSELPATVVVEEEIRHEAASFDAEAAARGKHITLTFLDALRPIKASEALVMRQVLGILLDNAIRYAEAGEIRVATRVDDNQTLVVQVTDAGSRSALTGAGPSEAGAGLGLQLCALLLSRAGGALHITSGTAVVVEARLPVTVKPPPTMVRQ